MRPGRLSEAPWRLPEGRAGGRGGGSGGSLEAWEALGGSQAGGKLEAGRLEAGWRQAGVQAGGIDGSLHALGGQKLTSQ